LQPVLVGADQLPVGEASTGAVVPVALPVFIDEVLCEEQFAVDPGLLRTVVPVDVAMTICRLLGASGTHADR